MRILHVNLAKRGIGRYGLLIGRALAEVHGADTLSIYDKALLEGSLLREQIQGVHASLIDWSEGNRVAGLRELGRIAAAFKPDVIHDSGGCYARSLPIWLALRRFAPLVVTEHDPEPHLGRSLSLPERATRAMMPKLMSHIFVHGPYCESLLLQRGVDRKRISLIRHGHLGMFDRSAVPPRESPGQAILFFGELRYNKGVDLLLEIADRVVARFPSARFVVAGSSAGAQKDSDMGPRVMRAIRDMKGRPCFEVHDRFIPDEDVESFFRQCAITVMPYREATQSGIAMIAMPLGSVVVATRVGDIPEVVQDGTTGLLAEPTAESVSEKIITLLERPEQLARMRRAALKFVYSECRWEGAAKHIVSQCESLLPARVDSNVV